MMKKVLIILALLAVTGIASADVIYDASAWTATNAWMNVKEGGVTLDPGTGGAITDWGQGWGVADARFNGTPGDYLLQSNIAASGWNYPDDHPTNPGEPDPYWAYGNLGLDMNIYTETWGLIGENVQWNWVVGENTLAGVDGFLTRAFIKVLDPDAGWATVQQVYADLDVGAGSLNLTVLPGVGDDVVTQVGFQTIGINDEAGSPTADLGVTIVPEPATMALLGVGGLFLRRRKK